MIRSTDNASTRSHPETTGLGRSTLQSAHGFKVSLVKGYVAEPTVRSLHLRPRENMVMFSQQGSILYRCHETEQQDLLASHSALFACGIGSLALFYTRGHHRWIEVEWNSAKTQALSDWVDDYLHAVGEPHLASKSLLGSRTLPPETIQRFIDTLEEDWSTSEPNVMSFVHDVVGALVAEEHNGLLTTIPSESSSIMRGLMDAVKRSPAENWALKDAADRAGYSAFHLSRSFRSLVGFGFPEFVDRCRTELAIKELLHSEEMVEDVARKCGFGSTQALRSACKEYTGLLPSEFRQLPVARI